MSNLERDIGSDDLKITDVIDLLRKDQWLIPTFQRDFVWQPENIIKLWDSIFRFYPIGSLLYWETDSYLHTHRKLGGFTFPHDEDTVRKFKEWKYILDGQQRATSLLVSLLGGEGRVQDNESFDYTLYFDATKAEFFFANEMEERKKTVRPEYLIGLRNVPKWPFSFYKDISAVEGFNQTIEQNLQQLSKMFTDYKISVVRIKGVQVNEVCEIFERINQEGKKLHPVDIIVARTYRATDPVTQKGGFYLRDYLEGLRDKLVEQGNRFKETDDLNVIQMVALCLRKKDTAKRTPFGITPAALDNLKAQHFEQNWKAFSETFYATVKFLCDLRIHGPDMLPYVYLMLALCYYFHQNKKVNVSLARQWFWRTAFGADDFRTSSDVYQYCDGFFTDIERGKSVSLPPMSISKSKLIQVSYNYRNAFSRAVLAFMASQNPIDFSDPQANVLDNVYLLLSQSPNLHHVYPLSFLKRVQGLPTHADANSLMNICFLRALTNIKIGDKNPLTYFREFEGKGFDRILTSHMIPKEFITRKQYEPADYGDFLQARAQLFAERLEQALPDVRITITE